MNIFKAHDVSKKFVVKKPNVDKGARRLGQARSPTRSRATRGSRRRRTSPRPARSAPTPGRRSTTSASSTRRCRAQIDVDVQVVDGSRRRATFSPSPVRSWSRYGRGRAGIAGVAAPDGRPSLDRALAAPRRAVHAQAPDPARADGLEPHHPDRAGRGQDPPRPQDEDVDLRRDLPRARRSAAPPASARPSPSSTGCPRRPASSPSTSTARTRARRTTASPAASPAPSRARSTATSRPASPSEAAGNDLLIAPGAKREYRYDFTEDGADERAAMHWYHDHRLDRTGENVWRGLAGMWITEDEVDLALPLPRGERDLPLMIADRDFDSKNQLTDPVRPPDPARRRRPGQARAGERRGAARSTTSRRSATASGS